MAETSAMVGAAMAAEASATTGKDIVANSPDRPREAERFKVAFKYND
jgi:hypothetical protein